MRIITTASKDGARYYLIPENIPDAEGISDLSLEDYTLSKSTVTINGKATLCIVLHPCSPTG
jgi:hypothetical protein